MPLPLATYARRRSPASTIPAPNARTMARQAAHAGRRGRRLQAVRQRRQRLRRRVHRRSRRPRRRGDAATRTTSGRTSGCSRGGALNADGTKVFGYLTVPEDCRIGVCAHELGHLLFGWPDLYDTDESSSGLGKPRARRDTSSVSRRGSYRTDDSSLPNGLGPSRLGAGTGPRHRAGVRVGQFPEHGRAGRTCRARCKAGACRGTRPRWRPPRPALCGIGGESASPCRWEPAG